MCGLNAYKASKLFDICQIIDRNHRTETDDRNRYLPGHLIGFWKIVQEKKKYCERRIIIFY